ncbi:RTA1 domain protein [Massarina eburnea CBS 473.64]|uniref:RTA1 domain protein n=1 Tax=Massarina eburnea CBS 473.64 TaxID=1395130 RepID=A0A6A6RFZ7_9PLEO|nr:RTA1 domain protein [Massarina eburnea CBS 473.64]
MVLPDGKPVDGSVYFYAPSKTAPIIFAVLFLASGAFHTYQCVRYKSWKITGLHPFCCLLFTVGFGLRAYGAFNFNQLTVYIISTICIYSAPPIIELANYHVLGRILYYVPYFSPLHPGRTLTTFGTLSAIVEILNALGVSYLANPDIAQKTQDLGHVLMKTALIAQLVVLSVFISIGVIVHQRCNKAGIKNRKVQSPILTMYISTALIFARTIYRIVELFGFSRAPANPDANWVPMSLSPLVRYEWFFYVFEAVLMYWNSVLWNASHPCHHLPEDYHVYLAQDGMTELRGPGWKGDQNWIMSFLDPCGLLGRGKGKEKPFWEDNGYSDHLPLVKRGDRQDVGEGV